MSTASGAPGGSSSDSKLAWASGAAIFAASLLMMLGIFQAIEGIAAIANDERFAIVGDYVWKFDATAWGWWHLIVGIIAILVAVGLINGSTWARVAGIVLAVISAFTQFMWLPVYPVWAIVIIALNVAIIWGLAVLLGDD
jgi:hypothetical protein